MAWVLNIRGEDNPNSPIPNCRLIVGKKNELILIAQNENGYKRIMELSSKSFIENDNLTEPHCKLDDLFNKQQTSKEFGFLPFRSFLT